MSDQTISATQSAVRELIEKIRSKAHSRSRVVGWLQAVNALDLNRTDVEAGFLEVDLYRALWPAGIEVGVTSGWHLWQYPGERDQIRRAICEAYDVSPLEGPA